MKNVLIIIIVILAIAVLSAIGSFIGVWNNLNQKYQAVQGGKSTYSAALKVCSEKIEGVWIATNQYMKHEAKTQTAVAEARSGYNAASEAFKQAIKEGKDIKDLTKAGNEVVTAALAFRVQIEAYPNLKAIEATNENIRNMEEATNEIKTALDDWIFAIKNYNTYRGYFLPNILGGFMGKFPSEIQYYEGEVKSLDVKNLNPDKKE